jgi:hypothetical protein
VTPGTTYYFDLSVLSGDSWSTVAYNYNYAGGTGFSGGVDLVGSDLWFREGIIIPAPEPGTLGLGLLGGGVFWLVRRRANKTRA